MKRNIWLYSAAALLVGLALAGMAWLSGAAFAAPDSHPPAAAWSQDAPLAPNPACDPYQYTTDPMGNMPPGQVDTGNHCDDCTTPINLPFPVTLYGQTFNLANVSSNGNVQFG